VIIMQGRSISDIAMDVMNQLTTLLRKEGQLARAEVSEKVSRVAAGLGLLVGGAVLLIPALVILLQAGAAALEEQGFAQPLAALIVGGSALIIGLILAAIGISRLKVDRLVPYKTIYQLRRDASVAKHQTGHEHERHQAA